MSDRRPHPSGSGQRRPATSSQRPTSAGRSASGRPQPRTATGQRSGAPRGSSARQASVRSGSRGGSRAGATRAYRPAWRLQAADQVGRIRIVMVALMIALSLAGARLFQLQVLDTQGYAKAAAKQAEVSRALPALRGTITDRNGEVLAASQPAVNIICDPTKIKPDELLTVAQVMAAHLGGTPYSYIPALSTPNTLYTVIKKQVPTATFTDIYDELTDLGINPVAISRESSPTRSYPAGSVASNVVGFVDNTGIGAGGLEYSLNQQLAGKAGSEDFETSVYGRMPLGAQQVTPAVNGVNYQLTIDSEMQAQAEMATAQAVTRDGAKTGTTIIMNIKTGEVLAMANVPGFDPNHLGDASAANIGNRAVNDAYEPGSVQKVLTFAAMEDLGLVTPDTQVVVPTSLRSGDADITDEHVMPPHLNSRGVLGRSSNVATAMLARQMTRQQYLDYMAKFGLGKKTGIELPGEASGYIDQNMTDPVRDRAAFGQAISVTAIQEAAAIAGIANHGIYNSPTILKSATDANGRPVALPPRPEARRIISEKASADMVDLMENVVTVASLGNFVIDNYRTMGKTGTAQRYDAGCGCYNSNTVSYVGMGPVEDPSILVYTVIDQPTIGEPSGADQAEPTVKDLLSIALPRYGVPFSTQPARKEAEQW